MLTDANGLATSPPIVANATPGDFSATATVTGSTTTLSYALHNLAARLFSGGTFRRATVEHRYSHALNVRVRGADGTPLAGVTVTFAVGKATDNASAGFSDGTSQATTTTNNAGIATAPSLTANSIAGTFKATATVAGSKPISYTLTNRAGRPDTIVTGAADGTSTTIGSRLPIRLAVTVTDKNGNPVSGTLVRLTAPSHGPGGVFTIGPHRSAHSVRVRTNAEGIAIAPTFTANRVAGGYSVAVPRRLETGRVRARQPPVTSRQVPRSLPAAPELPRLRVSDLARVASVGLRTRRVRAALSALGIAIGVAAIVAVLGLSSSCQAGLLAEIDKLGTNLLTVTNGQTFFGQTAELPLAAPGMIARIGPVQQVQYTGSTTANVYRSPLIPAVNTNALSVQAASLGLPQTVGATVAAGSFLNVVSRLSDPITSTGSRIPQSKNSCAPSNARTHKLLRLRKKLQRAQSDLFTQSAMDPRDEPLIN